MSTSTKASPEAAPSAPNQLAASGRVPRLAITLGLLLVVALKPHVVIPGVDMSGVAPPAPPDAFDLFALGITPFISAAIVVELLSLVRPRWRALRHGGPEGRAKLMRAALVLGVVLCGFQSFGITRLAESIAATGPVALTSSFSVSVATLSMTAAACLLALLAMVGSVRGIASGFAVLSVGLPILSSLSVLRDADFSVAVMPIAKLAALWLVGVTATVLALRQKPRRPLDAGEPGYRNPPGAAPKGAFAIPVPASGVTPLVATSTVLALPQVAKALGAHLPGTEGLGRELPSRVAALILLAATTWLFTWLYNTPRRVSALVVRTGDDRSMDEAEIEANRGLREAWIRSFAFVMVLWAIGQVSGWLLGFSVQVVSMAAVTALGMDILAEWRARAATPDLVAVWPEHRSYAVPIAREALTKEGITVHARGESLHRLLQFYGPYAPVDLMVPRADAERAREILEGILWMDPEARDEPRERPEPAAARPWTRPESILMALSIALAAGTIVVPTAKPLGEKDATTASAEALEITAVDDEADLFAADSADLPRGVSLSLENVPLGKDGDGILRTAPRRYARIVKQEGETMAATRARLVGWARTLPLSPGQRVLPSVLTEWNDATDRADPVGFRTYVVKGAPIIDGAHVRAAHASPNVDPTPGWYVGVTLTPEGAERFRAFTAANVKRRLAIVVDGLVESAPVIQAEIGGGAVTITMGAGDPEQQKRDAQKLERRLRGE